MIYITGDTHGGADVKKLVSRQVTDTLKKDDILIICGDFGFIWDPKKEGRKEKPWLEWFEKMPWTTVFADGNHECFPRLYSYPEKEWNGGKVHVIRDNLLHLERGNIYTIDGQKIYVMGGASSHDKFHTPAYEGKGWWPEELPNEEEYALSEANLNACGREVDCIITHCLPTSLQQKLNKPDYKTDHLTDYLETIMHNTTYKHWYCGHYHEDTDLDNNISVVFKKVIPIYNSIGESDPIPGSPIYGKGTSVMFIWDGKETEGTIQVVYPWGLPTHKNEPVYDIRTYTMHMVNHVGEKEIKCRLTQF